MSETHISYTPIDRPRRLRINSAMRALVRETRPHPTQLVLPVFVREDITEPRAIPSMPGVFQHTLDSFRSLLAECVSAGIGGIDLFGIPTIRDAEGSAAWDENGILNRAIETARTEVGDELIICADTCLDEFTDHGHCGILRPDGTIDNDETVQLYTGMALAQAAAGAHMVSPSGMMDGQIAAIRSELDAAGFTDIAILAYSAKYASSFYGPFRDAVNSQLQGDRKTYQQDPANRREGLREALLDIAEGADIVMVKPASHYLDVLADVAAHSDIPVAAYQVSGEYSMIEAAAAQGWIDRERAIDESLTGIVRAGADIVFTYWAIEAAGRMR